MPGISYVDTTEQYHENHHDFQPDHTGGTHQQATGSRDNFDNNVSSGHGTSDIFSNFYEPYLIHQQPMLFRMKQIAVVIRFMTL